MGHMEMPAKDKRYAGFPGPVKRATGVSGHVV
jgi:hypothetical protein